MKTPHPRRNSAALPTPRWLSYAVAGAASALAAAPSAEAAIHYSGPINRWVGGSNELRLPLDQAGDSIQLRHSSLFSSTGYGGTARFAIIARGGGAVAGFYNTCTANPRVDSASKIARNDLISARPFLQRRSAILAAFSSSRCGGGYLGQFDQGTIGFVGFRFSNASGGDQYGWARIRMGRSIDNTFRLIDYAYGDVGDSIRAGQESSDDNRTAEKSALGGLALGAAGVLGWRQTRSRHGR